MKKWIFLSSITIVALLFDYFFNEMENSVKKSNLVPGMSDNEQDAFGGKDDDVMQRKETIKLVRAYYSISNKKLRQSVLEHIKILSKTDNDAD